MNMNNTEPRIHVGILSGTVIEFVLNGDFVSTNGRTYSGKQKAEYKDGKVFFADESVDELIFEPTTGDTSFDLLNVVIGINFHWNERKPTIQGALKFIVEDQKLTAINRIDVEDYLTSVISVK